MSPPLRIPHPDLLFRVLTTAALASDHCVFPIGQVCRAWPLQLRLLGGGRDMYPLQEQWLGPAHCIPGKGQGCRDLSPAGPLIAPVPSLLPSSQPVDGSQMTPG